VFKLEDILKATSGVVICQGQEQFNGVSIDTRMIEPNDLFIAIKGERYDGHDFLDSSQAMLAGAVIQRVDQQSSETANKTIILVADTLKALQNIARYHRKKESPLVIAVTGSNGKTTAKEMTAAVQSMEKNTLKSQGNFNNQIGLPLTLCQIDSHDVVVVEMGARACGDIRELCEIAAPDIGIITNIGAAHLEGFGSLEGVRKAKLEMMDYVEKLLINADDRFLSTGVIDKLTEDSSRHLELYTYGINNDADFKAVEVSENPKGMGISFTIKFPNNEYQKIRLKTGGIFNVYNALAACGAGYLTGINKESMAEALSDYSGVSMRFEMQSLMGAVVINDAYNANPASIRASVTETVRLKQTRAIVVLGDMLELGIYSIEEHRKLGQWLASMDIDVFIALGPMMKYAHAQYVSRLSNGRSKSAFHMEDTDRARRIIFELIQEKDTILIKGSRAMGMENIIRVTENIGDCIPNIK
jgi:UDP-N-acetylmuramoyl-tripeptide--D-alanyl-D-alanine ligase